MAASERRKGPVNLPLTSLSVSCTKKLFKKWNELEITHSMNFSVFFSRTSIQQSGMHSESDGRLSKDGYGRLYEDHNMDEVDNETLTHWDSLIVRIRGEFVRYLFKVGR
jgi:hypothetical protein